MELQPATFGAVLALWAPCGKDRRTRTSVNASVLVCERVWACGRMDVSAGESVRKRRRGSGLSVKRAWTIRACVARVPRWLVRALLAPRARVPIPLSAGHTVGGR